MTIFNKKSAGDPDDDTPDVPGEPKKRRSEILKVNYIWDLKIISENDAQKCEQWMNVFW